MAYLNTIPVADDLLSLSQAQILENFAQLETQFSVDHDSLLPAGATGSHVQVTLPEFAVAADPTPGADEGMVYTKDSGTQPELYYREESAGDIVQLTEAGYTNTFVKAFVYFNGAGVVQGTGWNVDAVTGVVRNGVGDYTITFDTALSDANYTALLTPEAGGRERAVDVQTKLAGSIQVRCYVSSSGTPAAVDAAMNVVIYRIDL